MNNTVPVVYIAIVIGVIVLVLIILIFLIGLCFIRMCYLSKVQHKALQNVTYEMKDITKEQDDPVTDDPHSDDIHHSTFTNPDEVINATYSCIEKTAIATVTDGTYSVIHSDNMSTQMQESGHYDNVNKESFQDDAKCDEILYATISTPVTTTNTISIESSQYAPPQVGDQTYAVPHSLDLAKAVKEEESVHSERLYSDVRSRKVPIVPTKSSDLKQYLDTCPVLNVGIYSESINPLDFTCSKEEDEEGDPHFLAPIYPVPTMIPESALQPVEVTGNNIEFKNELGTGQFGEVMLADTNGLSLKDLQLSKTDENRDISLLVAVKKLRSQTQHDAFDIEVRFMSQLKHPNVVCLLGVCSNDPAFIMMEYMEEGDLNQFLQRYSEIVTSPSSDTQIATSSLVYMAFQIASAMKYLSALGFVHRDLAIRNCLIGKNNVIKVADLGVNMKLYQSNYYRIRGNKLLPIRWMATECFSGKFSEKSDIWAFGVTMWELFALGKRKPYPHLSDEEVIHNTLKREYYEFPSRSVACPQTVYDIMEQCWVIDMNQRAAFQELYGLLQMLL